MDPYDFKTCQHNYIELIHIQRYKLFLPNKDIIIPTTHILTTNQTTSFMGF